eukprot:TRINITY_DN41043_c0_g1_i1.p1 TRINITY_DN41043_c0_g1~~TRINITY_DN41043_c0_g1_i1.p1  ORF type:complete len:334 (-),score=56.71 TRINITY_DN41043_c0_g1_i1:211-1212(-)
MVEATLRPSSLRCRRSSWADLTAEELEFDEEVSAAPATFIDDSSYREAPVASLEDSKTGLNLRLSGTRCIDSGPKDFGFLQDARNASASSQASTPTTFSNSKLNVDAPEFVPTLSMVCPLVGVCHVSCEEKSPSDQPLTKEPQDKFTPEKLSKIPTPAWSAQKTSALTADRRKRRPTPLLFQASSMKRTKSEERLISKSPEAASCNRHRLSSDTQSLASELSSIATEEDWEHRGRVRSKAITICKQSAEYQWHTESLKDEDEPSTPNPLDRSISKRQWKHELQRWRNAIKRRYVSEGGGSVVSTEEWQSTVATVTEEADNSFIAECDEELATV